MSNALDSAFSSGSVIKFAEVGDAVTFTVTDVAEEERSDFDGNPENVIVIHGHDGTDDVRLFCSKGQLKHAIGVAVKDATGTQGAPKPGGQLHVKRGPDGQASKPGYSAPHSYTAKYKAPEPGSTAKNDVAFGGEDTEVDPF